MDLEQRYPEAEKKKKMAGGTSVVAVLATSTSSPRAS